MVGRKAKPKESVKKDNDLRESMEGGGGGFFFLTSPPSRGGGNG